MSVVSGHGSPGEDHLCTCLLLQKMYRVEEDVGRLEVPVDDLLLRRVQEGEAARRARGDLEPPAPRQRLQVSTPCSDRHFQFLTPSKSDCRTLNLIQSTMWRRHCQNL